MSEEREYTPLSEAELEKIRALDWSAHHDPLCGVALEDGPCSCSVGIVLRLVATVDAMSAKATEDRERAVKGCPWCKGPLQVYHSGVTCPKCVVYYERNAWWGVSCDENHAHGRGCLAEKTPPVGWPES